VDEAWPLEIYDRHDRAVNITVRSQRRVTD
jgi:hypothetical protein